MVKQWARPQRKWRAPSLHYNSCVSLLSISQVWKQQRCYWRDLCLASQIHKSFSLKPNSLRWIYFPRSYYFSQYVMKGLKITSIGEVFFLLFLSDVAHWLRNICVLFLNKLPASSSYTLTHADVLPNRRSFTERFLCLRLCQNVAHSKYYSNMNISGQSCLLYMSQICLFSLSLALSLSISIRADLPADGEEILRVSQSAFYTSQIAQLISLHFSWADSPSALCETILFWRPPLCISKERRVQVNI